MPDAPEVTNGLPARSRYVIPWFAVLTQLLTIIAGVLIALAAQAWWSGREDRNKEARYLRQLRADVIENQKRFSSGVAYEDSAIHRASRMLQMLRSSGDAPPNDSIAVWDYSSTGPAWRPVTGTLRALMSTGDIALVRDDSLRAAIIQYDADLEAVESTLARQHSEFLTRSTTLRARVTPHVTHPSARWQDTLIIRRDVDRYDIAGMRRDRLVEAAFVSSRATYAQYRLLYEGIRNAGGALLGVMERRGPLRSSGTTASHR